MRELQKQIIRRKFNDKGHLIEETIEMIYAPDINDQRQNFQPYNPIITWGGQTGTDIVYTDNTTPSTGFDWPNDLTSTTTLVSNILDLDSAVTR